MGGGGIASSHLVYLGGDISRCVIVHIRKELTLCTHSYQKIKGLLLLRNWQSCEVLSVTRKGTYHCMNTERERNYTFQRVEWGLPHT